MGQCRSRSVTSRDRSIGRSPPFTGVRLGGREINAENHSVVSISIWRYATAPVWCQLLSKPALSHVPLLVYLFECGATHFASMANTSLQPSASSQPGKINQHDPVQNVTSAGPIFGWVHMRNSSSHPESSSFLPLQTPAPSAPESYLSQPQARACSPDSIDEPYGVSFGEGFEDVNLSQVIPSPPSPHEFQTWNSFQWVQPQHMSIGHFASTMGQHSVDTIPAHEYLTQFGQQQSTPIDVLQSQCPTPPSSADASPAYAWSSSFPPRGSLNPSATWSYYEKFLEIRDLEHLTVPMMSVRARYYTDRIDECSTFYKETLALVGHQRALLHCVMYLDQLDTSQGYGAIIRNIFSIFLYMWAHGSLEEFKKQHPCDVPEPQFVPSASIEPYFPLLHRVTRAPDFAHTRWVCDVKYERLFEHGAHLTWLCGRFGLGALITLQDALADLRGATLGAEYVEWAKPWSGVKPSEAAFQHLDRLNVVSIGIKSGSTQLVRVILKTLFSRMHGWERFWYNAEEPIPYLDRLSQEEAWVGSGGFRPCPINDSCLECLQLDAKNVGEDDERDVFAYWPEFADVRDALNTQFE